MFIYIYIYFLFCKITVWYKKNNSIIMKIQKIIKRINFCIVSFSKSQVLKNKKELLIYNYI